MEGGGGSSCKQRHVYSEELPASSPWWILLQLLPPSSLQAKSWAEIITRFWLPRKETSNSPKVQGASGLFLPPPRPRRLALPPFFWAYLFRSPVRLALCLPRALWWLFPLGLESHLRWGGLAAGARMSGPLKWAFPPCKAHHPVAQSLELGEAAGRSQQTLQNKLVPEDLPQSATKLCFCWGVGVEKAPPPHRSPEILVLL